MGPSRPPDPPEVKVMADAMVFDNGNAAADKATLVMVGIDGGIRAVSFGLRRKSIHKPPADNPPENRQKKEHPSIEDRLRGFKKVSLTGGSGWSIPGHLVQQEMGTDLTKEMKKNGTQTCYDTNQDKIKAPFTHRCNGIGLCF